MAPARPVAVVLTDAEEFLSPMRPVSPRGFRDVLPAEAAEREVIVNRVNEVFSAWGYGRVESPVVERLETLEAATAGPMEGTAFRLVDLDGRLLALRPDLTVPIARVVATRMQEACGPHRLRYAAEAFREHESLRGQARQFTQMGVEFIGESGPAADAEIISLLAEALAATALTRFTIAVGSVEIFSAILSVAGKGEAWAAAVMRAAHERNFVELDRLSREADVKPAAAAALRAVPKIRGGREAIGECREATRGCGCDEILDTLDETFSLLTQAGCDQHVMVDFSVMRSFDYYTGIVVEAYAPGVGLPLAGGGRYDSVLANFDASAPAAGFAIGLERLSIALVEEGVTIPVPRLDAVIGGGVGERLALAARLRAAGLSVVLSRAEGGALATEARARCARFAVLAAGDGGVLLDEAGKAAGELDLSAEGVVALLSSASSNGGEVL